MPPFLNPAVQAFTEAVKDELIFVQVLIRVESNGFSLRHRSDDLRSDSDLADSNLSNLRRLAQFTADGRYRPLSSAPDLVSGWRLSVSTAEELGEAMERLYPGGIADWYAARSDFPPVTIGREFVSRQSGRYRVTSELTDPQASEVTRACCCSEFCLKRRLWTIAALPVDVPRDKSVFPCLEPCALWLDFARWAVVSDREERRPVSVSSGEAATLKMALNRCIDGGVSRGEDIPFPGHPHRAARLLQRLESQDDSHS